MNLNEKIQAAYFGLMLIGIIILVYKTFTKPGEKTEKSLEISEARCEEKHKRVDEKFDEISGTLTLIKENHLKHIENDIGELKCSFAELKGILLGKEK